MESKPAPRSFTIRSAPIGGFPFECKEWMWGCAYDVGHFGVIQLMIMITRARIVQLLSIQIIILIWVPQMLRFLFYVLQMATLWSVVVHFLIWKWMHLIASEMMYERKRKYPALRTGRGFGSNVLAARSDGEKQHASSMVLILKLFCMLVLL